MAQGLVIPIDVQAFCVSQKDAESGPVLRGSTADFSVLPYASDGPKNPGPATSDDVLDERKSRWTAGVHLHWAMPDALAHGHHDKESGQTNFAPLPNRWLVTRIVTRGGGVRKDLCRSWVIESDRLSKDPPRPEIRPSTTTVPTRPDDYQSPDGEDAVPASHQPFMYLGDSCAYDAWQEGRGEHYLYQCKDIAPYKLTAITYGDPLFAGYYPNCASVFGFLDEADDLHDVQTGDALAYHVVGWYVAHDPTDDPLAGATLKPAPCPLPTASDIAGKTEAARRYARFLKHGPAVTDGAWSYIEDKKWLFTAPAADLSPTFTLCSGLVQNIAWDARRSYLEELSGKARLAVGNSPAEAMSALVNQRLGADAPADLEDTLNALQLGVLQGLDGPHGKGAYDEALHRSRFGSAHGGVLWQVSRRGEKDPGEVTLPREQAAALNQLNVLQLATDELAERIAARERQFFADWHKYQTFMRTPADELEKDAMDELGAVIYALREDYDPPMDLIGQQIADHEAACGQLEANKRSIEQQSRSLAGQLDAAHELILVPAPKYWHSNDPVLLMSGDPIEPILRHGGDGRLRDDEYLECRLTTEVLAASAYDLGPGGSLPHRAEIAALVAEAALTASVGLPDPAPQGKKLPSAIGVVAWQKNPWMPLLMEWSVHYEPMKRIPHEHTDAAYSRDLITSRYDWNVAGTDLVANQGATTEGSYFYSNLTILSDHPAASLADAIAAYLDSHADLNADVTAALKRAQTSTKDLPVLAQSLGGFQRGLLMERQVLQLGLADPLYETGDEIDFWRDCAAAAQKMDMSRNDAAPDPANNFAPIRAGFMRLGTLRLIGVFGREVEIEVHDPAVARSLQPPAQKQIDEHLIALAPGVTQPSRLLFDWLSAATDKVEYTRLPAASPVCGWVLFNHLDDSLVFYTGAGEAVGSLTLSQDESTTIWEGAPGTPTFSQTLDEAFAGGNPHLAAFARGLDKDGATFLRSLLLTIDASLGTVLPAGATRDTSTAVLLSRPLALVRASLRLSLQGGPAVSQSWEAFQKAADPDAPAPRSTAAFEKVQFPVRLGKVEDLDDGLLGYFVQDDYTRFYSAAADGSHDKVTPPRRDTLLVDGTGTPVEVTMLIDPRASVRATIGVVPSQTLVVPPDQVTAALRRMSVTFLTAPVLCAAGPAAFPVPAEGNGVWSWVTRGDPPATVAKVNPGQTRSYSPQTLVEGWLRLTT